MHQQQQQYADTYGQHQHHHHQQHPDVGYPPQAFSGGGYGDPSLPPASIGRGGWAASMNGNMSMGKPRGGRAGLPTQWMEPQQQSNVPSYNGQQHQQHPQEISSRSISPPLNPLPSHLSSTSISPPLEHAMFNPYGAFPGQPLNPNNSLNNNNLGHGEHHLSNHNAGSIRYGSTFPGLGNGTGGGGNGANPAAAWGGSGQMLGGGVTGIGGAGPFSMGPGVGGGMDDDVIPTAIVIKNINFNLQKEDLLRTIESLGAPLPYAFNYHMDQGVFRGLAFANFRSPLEADAVVAALNGYDVGGRKLRVEYKKVLQAGEKERIEREKALRRMRSIQLPPPPSAAERNGQQQLSHHPSAHLLPGGGGGGHLVSAGGGGGGLGGGGPEDYPGIQPISMGLGLGSGMRGDGRERSETSQSQIPIVQVNNAGGHPRERSSVSAYERSDEASDGSVSKAKSAELDLNDATTLDIYSRVLVFKEDRMRDELAFSRTLTALQRRVVHLVAQKLGVYHYSVGEGDERYAVVTRSEGRAGPGERHLNPHHHHQQQQQQQQQQNNLYASSPALSKKASMPDLSQMHGPSVARDPTRAILPQRSNGNLRDGYHTVSSGSGARRSQTGGPLGAFQQTLFGDSGLSPSHIPIPSPSSHQQPHQHQRHATDGPSSTSPNGMTSNADDTSLLSSSPSSTTHPSPIQASQSPASLRAPRGPPGGFAARRFVVGPAVGSGLPSAPTPGAGRISPSEANVNGHGEQQQQQWGAQEQEDFATSLEALEV